MRILRRTTKKNDSKSPNKEKSTQDGLLNLPNISDLHQPFLKSSKMKGSISLTHPISQH